MQGAKDGNPLASSRDLPRPSPLDTHATACPQDMVLTPLAPGMDLPVGLEVQYDHHQPRGQGTWGPHATNIRILTPLPWPQPPAPTPYACASMGHRTQPTHNIHKLPSQHSQTWQPPQPPQYAAYPPVPTFPAPQPAGPSWPSAQTTNPWPPHRNPPHIMPHGPPMPGHPVHHPQTMHQPSHAASARPHPCAPMQQPPPSLAHTWPAQPQPQRAAMQLIPKENHPPAPLPGSTAGGKPSKANLQGAQRPPSGQGVLPGPHRVKHPLHHLVVQQTRSLASLPPLPPSPREQLPVSASSAAHPQPAAAGGTVQVAQREAEGCTMAMGRSPGKGCRGWWLPAHAWISTLLPARAKAAYNSPPDPAQRPGLAQHSDVCQPPLPPPPCPQPLPQSCRQPAGALPPPPPLPPQLQDSNLRPASRPPMYHTAHNGARCGNSSSSHPYHQAPSALPPPPYPRPPPVQAPHRLQRHPCTWQQTLPQGPTPARRPRRRHPPPTRGLPRQLRTARRRRPCL